MVLVLDATKLATLNNYVQNNDTVGYYQALASWGSEYAANALQVVQENTVYGKTAIAYLETVAQNSHIVVTGAIKESLKLDLMCADYTARLDNFNDNNKNSFFHLIMPVLQMM